jgi:hypothetical protein
MAANGTFPETSRRRGGGGRQEAALAALLAQPTHTAAAQACGVSLRTLQRWLREPEFAERYQQAKCELVSGTTTQLRANGIQAVQTLQQVATSAASPPAARVAAARAILEYLFRGHEDEDIAARLDRLESDRSEDEKF